MKEISESFFKPVLSTLGLIFSFIAAISPLFPVDNVGKYFQNEDFVSPASIVSVAIGVIVTWVVFAFVPYLSLNFLYYKPDELPYKIARIQLGPPRIILILLLVELGLFYAFFNILSDNLSLQTIQAIIYIAFFDILIFIFAYLVSTTKSRYDFLEQKDMQADIIFRTLEKSKLISPGISIYENKPLTQQEIQNLQISMFGIFRKVKVQTVVQKKE